MQEKHYAAFNKSIDHQIEALKHIVKLNPILNTIICSAPKLNLDGRYYLGAGCITQTVWNYLSKEIYEKKVLKWRELWPQLKIISWC